MAKTSTAEKVRRTKKQKYADACLQALLMGEEQPKKPRSLRPHTKSPRPKRPNRYRFCGGGGWGSTHTDDRHGATGKGGKPKHRVVKSI